MTDSHDNTAGDDDRQAISVDIASDAVCPWCFIGARRLQRAVAMRPQLAIRINWRPFQLDPTIPPGGVERAGYMLAKFGDQARIDATHARLSALGQEEGIDFHFERITRAPNTLDAHRIIRWAQGTGRQTDLAERLFALYFCEGADIGDPAVLRAAALEAGLDGDVVAQRLAGDWDKQEVREEIEVAVRLGITGVPFYIVDGRFGIAGAQPAEAMAAAFDKAASE